MTKKPKNSSADNQKFQDEIDDWREKMQARNDNDLELIDKIPNFTGEDEPIPFPYGSGTGKNWDAG